VRRYIAEAEALGMRELYFTGGEPFLHPEILPLLETALAVAPTTVLTNGTLIDAATADRLAALAAGSPYSLEIRVSLDGATAEDNDAIRGRGSFVQAMTAIRILSARGLYPIVTATEIARRSGVVSLYDRLRALLMASGVDKPRIKLLPLFPVGRLGNGGPNVRIGEDGTSRLVVRPIGSSRLLTDEDLDGFDTARLQCTAARVIADGGIYACPILAGLPAARVGAGRLADAVGATTLSHRACVTCYESGASRQNF
jgi:AdoMet-dependent heme synthase